MISGIFGPLSGIPLRMYVECGYFLILVNFGAIAMNCFLVCSCDVSL